MSKLQKINTKPSRYLVFFPGYDANSEEFCENYSSYNCVLDNSSGITKSYSQAVAAADSHNGNIYAEVNGDIIEVEKKKFKT